MLLYHKCQKMAENGQKVANFKGANIFNFNEKKY